MNPAMRVLLAADSVTVRRLLTETLSKEPLLEVCHAAHDGREAVTQFPLVHPDIVLLDVEMPVMDGIEAVIAIRRINPRIPIIMFSSLTIKGGEATLDALTHGATDYVTKPTRVGHLQDAVLQIRNELVPRIKHWGQWYKEQHHSAGRAASPMTLSRAPVGLRREPFSLGDASVTARGNVSIDVIAIGASTGGPNALADMLKRLPRNFTIPILIAQHMPPLFTTLLADRLNQVCPLNVREGVDGAAIESGQVWIAPGDQHLVVEKQGFNMRLRLDHGPPENSCRPSVDVLFRSVAAAYGERAVTVVMTGMGQDGTIGCQHIRNRGGKVIAQDQDSSVVWGMPRAVAEAGLADRVLPLNGIADELIRLSQCGRTPTAGLPPSSVPV